MPSTTRGRKPAANESSLNKPLESTTSFSVQPSAGGRKRKYDVTTSKAHDGFLTLHLPKDKFRTWVETNDQESIESDRLSPSNTPGEPFLTVKFSPKRKEQEPLQGSNQTASVAVLVDEKRSQGDDEPLVSSRSLEQEDVKSTSPWLQAQFQPLAPISASPRAADHTGESINKPASATAPEDQHSFETSEADTAPRQPVIFKLPSRSSRVSLIAPAFSPITPGLSPITPGHSPGTFPEVDAKQSSADSSETSKAQNTEDHTVSIQASDSAAFETSVKQTSQVACPVSSDNTERDNSEAKLRSENRVGDTASPVQQSDIGVARSGAAEAGDIGSQSRGSLPSSQLHALQEEKTPSSVKSEPVIQGLITQETITPEPQPPSTQTILTPSRGSERIQIPKPTTKRKASSTPLQESPPKRHTRQDSRADIVTSSVSKCFITLRVRPGYDPATMAPGTVTASDSLKDVIQNLYDIQSQTYGFRPETQPVLINQIEELTHSLAKLQDLADPITHPNSSLHELFVAPEIIDYVDDGRNPDIYGREFIETVQRGNAVLNGKKQAFKDFSVVFAQMLKEGIGGVDKQVDRVMEHAGMTDELNIAENEKGQMQGSGKENGDKMAI